TLQSAAQLKEENINSLLASITTLENKINFCGSAFENQAGVMKKLEATVNFNYAFADFQATLMDPAVVQGFTRRYTEMHGGNGIGFEQMKEAASQREVLLSGSMPNVDLVEQQQQQERLPKQEEEHQQQLQLAIEQQRQFQVMQQQMLQNEQMQLQHQQEQHQQEQQQQKKQQLHSYLSTQQPAMHWISHSTTTTSSAASCVNDRQRRDQRASIFYCE
ncbi:hypothetical protein HDU97_009807, partial [Phlyctochytrium planicorne]